MLWGVARLPFIGEINMNKMIPSEEWSSLNKNIHADENGNVVIGKNLEVDGTAKMNSGFKPIHQYVYEGCSINVYFEKETGSGFSFLGDMDEIYIVLGYYELDSGNIKNLDLLTTKRNGVFTYDGTWRELVRKS